MPAHPANWFPPVVDGAMVRRIPLRHRRDAAQEAWVAHLSGEDANATLWAYVKRQMRVEQRCQCFSQLDPLQWRIILSETAG